MYQHGPHPAGRPTHHDFLLGRDLYMIVRGGGETARLLDCRVLWMEEKRRHPGARDWAGTEEGNTSSLKQQIHLIHSSGLGRRGEFESRRIWK